MNVMGHPTSRKISERDPIAIDLGAVIEKAAEVGVALEINAAPERLDLSPEHARRAMEHGVRIAVNTDAHSIRELGNMRFGITSARRGWLAARDVINTWSEADLRDFLDRSGG